MYFNPAIEIYVFDDQATINNTTCTIEHGYGIYGLTIAKIEGYLCSNLKISCTRSLHDKDDNHTSAMLDDADRHDRFKFSCYGEIDTDSIYNEFFGCDSKVIHQHRNNNVLYKRVNSVLQFYMSIEHFSQWDKFTMIDFDPVVPGQNRRKCMLTIPPSAKNHLNKILSTYTESDIYRRNSGKTGKYSICSCEGIISRAQAYITDAISTLSDVATKPAYIVENNQQLLYSVFMEYIKDKSNGAHIQIIKRITNSSTIIDSNKIDMIKCLLDQLE